MHVIGLLNGSISLEYPLMFLIYLLVHINSFRCDNRHLERSIKVNVIFLYRKSC